jgi:hypothetical protein
MTILDHRFTMNPTVDAWKLIPLDLYNQINNVVNEQRLISKEHALDLDVSIPDGMISLISRNPSTIVGSGPVETRFGNMESGLRDSDDTKLEKYYEEKWSMTFQLRRPRKKVGGKKAHVQFMGVDDVQCQEVDMTVRVFYPWNAYKGVLPVLIETRRKGDWVTHVDADEVSRAQYSRDMLSLGLRRGPNGFDLQHHDFTVLQPLVNIVDSLLPYAPFVSEYHIEN